MYANNILDISDDVLFVELSSELGKYKTLSHSEIDWQKVYDNSVTLLEQTLDTRVFRGFVLSTLSLNNDSVFIKLNEVLGHYHSIWKDVYELYTKEHTKKAKLQNKFFIDPINELIEANNTYKVNISSDIVSHINIFLTDFNNSLDAKFKMMVVPVKNESISQGENNTKSNVSSTSNKSIESMDRREYRDYFFNLGSKLLEKDITNLSAYSLFWEGVWGKISQEISHKNNITEIRYPELNTINMLKNIEEYTYEHISKSFSNLLLNPFWFEGYKIFIDYAISQKKEVVADHIKLLVKMQLEKYPWLINLCFSNQEKFCSEDLYNYYISEKTIEVTVEKIIEKEIPVIAKPAKAKKEKTGVKSLVSQLHNIDDEVDESIKSKIDSLILIADAMSENNMSNNAALLYGEIIKLMESTILKDYLNEKYMQIKENIQINEYIEERE